MSPERLAEIRQQAADKFPSWTAMRELLVELDGAMIPRLTARALAFALCCADNTCQGGQDDGERVVCDHHLSVALRLIDRVLHA